MLCSCIELFAMLLDVYALERADEMDEFYLLNYWCVWSSLKWKLMGRVEIEVEIEAEELHLNYGIPMNL